MMEEQETDTRRNRGFEIFIWNVCIFFAVVMGVGLYQVRWLFPYVGYFSAACFALAVLAGLAWLFTHVIERFTFTRFRDIGQWGTITQNLLGHSKTYAPLAPGMERQKVEAKVEVAIPTVAELLKDGTLGTADLLLGFLLNGTPLWGTWDAVRTFCIAGKGRSGKTVTMFFVCIQIILNGGIVYVCDPHASKKSSITALLKPLSAFVKFAKSDTEIAELTDEFIDEMEARVEERSNDLTPRVLVIDEFTRIVNGDDGEKVFDAVIRCAQQYAGYQGFAIIAGHEWTGRGQLLAKLRRALHAKYIHRLDVEYAKYLLNSAKAGKKSPTLKTGYNLFQDTEGDIHELRTPLGVAEDAFTVLTMLQQLPSGPVHPEISGVSYMPELETRNFTRAETGNFRDEFHETRLISQPETKSFRTHEERREGVKMLRQLPERLTQAEIILRVWQVKPGGTTAYAEALDEYKQILQEITANV